MRKHKAVQFGLLSEEKAVEAAVAAVLVPAKAELLVDKRGNGLFDWFSGVAVVPRKPSVKSGGVRVESVKQEVEVAA